MSYDVYLVIDTGGPEPVDVFSRNHTSNTARMWREAGCDIAEFHGKSAPEFGAALIKAIHNMRQDPARYMAMEPENRWGTYETCLDFLAALSAACEANPKCEVLVSR